MAEQKMNEAKADYMEALMVCNNCGQKDEYNSQYCMKCGQPLQASAPAGEAGKADAQPAAIRPPIIIRPKRKRGLIIAIAACVVLLAVIILILALSANPVAGRWYSQSGKELILLQNGKGMTMTDGEESRIRFMYAIGYTEPGYIEGEIYEKEDGPSTWFYLIDGKLEFNGEYFYRQKPSGGND